VHCDVKPSNLLVRDDDVRIIDFDIARYAGEIGGGGIVECSRGRAAPEQLWTTAVTPAVDVFAWGCLLAQLASGVHPYASRSEQEWILRLHSAQPDLFGLPSGLDDLIRAALARDPHDRPTARELTAICRDRDDEHPPPARLPRAGGAASWPPNRKTATVAATVRPRAAQEQPPSGPCSAVLAVGGETDVAVASHPARADTHPVVASRLSAGRLLAAQTAEHQRSAPGPRATHHRHDHDAHSEVGQWHQQLPTRQNAATPRPAAAVTSPS
jgi:hypothetical protein